MLNASNNGSDVSTLVNGSNLANTNNYVVIPSIVILYVPGLILNVVSIIIIIRDVKILDIPTNAILSLLCVFDFLAIVNVVVWHSLRNKMSDFSTGVCACRNFMNAFFPLYTGVLSAIMALDRAIALGKPFWYKEKVTALKWVLVSCSATGFVCLIGILPQIGLGSNWKHEKPIPQCSYFGAETNLVQMLFAITYSTVGYILLILIVICNVIVIKATLLLSRRTDIHPAGGCVCAKNSYELLFARLVGSITLLYVICWAPYYVSIMTLFIAHN